MAASKKLSDRRAFLSFLAASPILAYAGLSREWMDQVLAAPLPDQQGIMIKSVREALSVFDFDAAARSKLSTAHYTFITDGSFNNETLNANRAGFAKYAIRLRRLTGISKVDQSVRLFGVHWESAVFLCPVGRINMFYPQGAVVEARAAQAKRTLMILSGEKTVEQVNAARGEPVWVAVQGPLPEPSVVKRVEAAGCPVLVWTIDGQAGGNTIGARSIQRAGVANLDREADARCAGCHANIAPVYRINLDTPPDIMGAIGALGGEPGAKNATIFTWDDVKRLKDMSSRMKLVLKGIVTRQDAELALQHGADGIIVSNHGGHEDGSGIGTIECLPEIVAGIGGKIPVMIDSGFRNGTDIYKALALGATAVGVGRPGIWGLASFGQEGVETVIELLRRELQVIMAQTGSSSIVQIRRDSLIPRS